MINITFPIVDVFCVNPLLRDVECKKTLAKGFSSDDE